MNHISKPKFDKREAERLIEQDKTDYQAINEDGKTELMLAFEVSGKTGLVDKLFESLANDYTEKKYWEHVDKDNRNVFMYACKYMKDSIVSKLLHTKGNNAGLMDKNGNTPLLVACTRLVELEDDGDDNTKDFKNTINIISMIVHERAGTDINVMAKTKDGKTALHLLCSLKFPSQERIIKELTNEDYDETHDLLNMEDNNGHDAYFYAVKHKVKWVIAYMKRLRGESASSISSDSSLKSGDYYIL